MSFCTAYQAQTWTDQKADHNAIIVAEPVKGRSQAVCSDLQFRESQFTYAVSAKLPTSYGNALSKLDAKNGSSKQWHEPGCITTEPLMIPRPGATAEVSLCPLQAPCHPAERIVKPLHPIVLPGVSGTCL